MKEQFGWERGCERVQEKKREGIGNKYYGNFFKEFYCEAEQRDGVEAGECGVGDGREFLIRGYIHSTFECQSKISRREGEININF